MLQYHATPVPKRTNIHATTTVNTRVTSASPTPAPGSTIPPRYAKEHKHEGAKNSKQPPRTAPAAAPTSTRPSTAPTAKKTRQTHIPVVKNEDTRPKTPRRRTLSVVLPPRNLSASSTTLIEDLLPPITIKNLHFENSYSPHKAHWIKNALENLGTTWIRDGKTTYDQLMSEEFEEKMGVFYDLAMAKKHDAIDRLVGEVDEEVDKNKSVHKNFPFAPHLSCDVKASMSDALFRIITKKEQDSNQSGSSSASNKKGKEEESVSSNSFERDLKNRKSLVQCYVIDGGKLVIGSKKGLLGVGGSFVNQFGDSKESKVRKNPNLMLETNLGFYRSIANMMGFLPHEIRIRYCRTSRQLVVSGARPQRDSENARQVREVLELPKNVDVRNLVVLRTTKGSLIFEEA